jgi:hypothetical protein
VQAIAIIVMSIMAAVMYGILHDQITARICIEYFTIGHPQILVFKIDSPTILGFAWGIVATWWVGAGLGLLLAAAARLGSRRKVDCSELIRPIILLMAVAGVLAAIAGLVGYYAARQDWIGLSGPLGVAVPADRHAAFLADAFTHSTSYLAGAIGGVVLIMWTWRARRFPVAPPSA